MKITRYKLSKKLQNRLLEYFVLQVTARSAADMLSIHSNSAALFYHKIRQIIAFHIEREAGVLDCEVEVDESCFGSQRKSKRGRGAAGKVSLVC